MHQWFFFSPDNFFFGTKLWRNVNSNKISIFKKKFNKKISLKIIVLYQKIEFKKIPCYAGLSPPDFFYFIKFPILQHLHKWKAKAHEKFIILVFLNDQGTTEKCGKQTYYVSIQTSKTW
jgi:hypothetical protein